MYTFKTFATFLNIYSAAVNLKIIICMNTVITAANCKISTRNKNIFVAVNTVI